MMVFSRFWYAVLSFLLGIALYVVFLAVGQYNRRNGVAMTEELASDSQTVSWALQIDARKRLDALLIGAVDKGVQDALVGANGKDAIPQKTKDDGKRALATVLDKIAADFRPDALFAVDHEGRVVAQYGYDAANAFADFELGGYPVVFDALHGYLRDDTWVLGGKIYRVVARPVEFDSTQPPLGAIVGMRAVDKKFAAEISKRTRANIAFFAGGQRVVSAALEGFDESHLTLVDTDLPKLVDDKEYGEGRSEVRFVQDNVGVMYARMFGDAWELGGGFVVARTKVTIDGPLGFLNGADDKDKQSVNFLLIAGIVLGGLLGGLALSFLEQSMPMGEMQRQGLKLKKGELDYFNLPRLRGPYRAIAQDVNAGIERVLEKGGGAGRKPADLESILGPVPAQPAMSAFSFPLAEQPAAPPRPGPPPLGGSPLGGSPLGGSPPPGPSLFSGNDGHTPPPAHLPGHAPGPGLGHAGQASGHAGGPGVGAGMAMAAAGAAMAGAAVRPPPPKPGPPAPPAPMPHPVAATAHGSHGSARIIPGGVPGDSPADGDGPTLTAPAAMRPPTASESGARPVGFPPPKAPARMGAPTMAGIGQQAFGPSAAISPTTVPHQFVPPGGTPAVGPQAGGAPAPIPLIPPGPQSSSSLSRQLQNMQDEAEDEATVVAAAPSELLAQAAAGNPGAAKAPNDTAEWMTVYDDFVRTKKQCGEPTEGLTFEKFQATLKKNRDALMQRHNCKKVRFSVYVKEGRASLKATPVRD
jgi:hypothetical protein